MPADKFDIAIIGGGIVGLATALSLAKSRPDLRLCVFEKEALIGEHQTSHNSGVIHSGIYYAPGSLKASLCVKGVGAMISFAKENGVPFEQCGKVIVATREEQRPRLRALFERGIANGVPGLRILNRTELLELEPHAEGLEAIHSPTTGIIDFRRAAEVMAEKFKAGGGSVETMAKMVSAEHTGSELVLKIGRMEIRTKYLINCGGLYSDTIALMLGVEPGVRIIPFRGEYYLIRNEKRHLVKNLIYPVPDPDLPFLGVHLTRTVDGKLEAGPNAILATAREGYRRSDWKTGEFLATLSSPHFWNMARRYWKTGILECYRAVSKRSFARELQGLIKGISEDDLVDGPSGVRAQCVAEDGTLVHDFKIVEGPRSIHVVNVPSPAATASLAIGEYIAGLGIKSYDERT